jgi:hypothetical protein
MENNFDQYLKNEVEANSFTATEDDWQQALALLEEDKDNKKPILFYWKNLLFVLAGLSVGVYFICNNISNKNNKVEEKKIVQSSAINTSIKKDTAVIGNNKNEINKDLNEKKVEAKINLKPTTNASDNIVTNIKATVIKKLFARKAKTEKTRKVENNVRVEAKKQIAVASKNVVKNNIQKIENDTVQKTKLVSKNKLETKKHKNVITNSNPIKNEKVISIENKVHSKVKKQKVENTKTVVSNKKNK